MLKCYKHNKIFNIDLVEAFNILAKGKAITLSPTLCGIVIMGPRPGARLNRAIARNVVQTSQP